MKISSTITISQSYKSILTMQQNDADISAAILESSSGFTALHMTVV